MFFGFKQKRPVLATQIDPDWANDSQRELRHSLKTIAESTTVHWRHTSRVAGDPPLLPVSFTTADGKVLRLLLDLETCERLTATIEQAVGRYYLRNSHCPKSAGTPSVDPSAGKHGRDG